MNRRSSSEKEIRIMVMGEIGVGKSTFIYATGAVASGDQGLSSKNIIDTNISPPPKGVEEFEVKQNSPAVILIEAPGFNELNRSDAQQLGVIIEWLKEMSETKPQAEINGIIYLFNGNNKFKENPHSMDANKVPNPPGVLFVTCNGEKRKDDLKAKFPMFKGDEDYFDGSPNSARKFIERIVSSGTSFSMQTFKSRLQEIPLAGKPAKSLARRLFGFFSSLFS